MLAYIKIHGAAGTLKTQEVSSVEQLREFLTINHIKFQEWDLERDLKFTSCCYFRSDK